MPAPNITYFDLEVHPKNNRILEYGAVCQNQTFRSPHPSLFQSFINKADIICGHNIIAHDLVLLRQLEFASNILDKPSIDTLMLSAWLFPKKPKHSLEKHYKNGLSVLNNPVEDAKLSKEILVNALETFHKLGEDLQFVFKELLKDQTGFNGFFLLTKNKDQSAATEELDLAQRIAAVLPGSICGKADVDHLVATHPVELAFALAVIIGSEEKVIMPAWVRKKYKYSDEVLNTLRVTCGATGECAYCINLDPLKGLKKYFGFDSFRKFDGDQEIALQEQVVRAALNNKSFIAIFPTGGGKSLTFQLPALMLGAANRSLTVVISPLQSLMKDQVDVLQRNHDINSAVAINGLLSPLERAEAIRRVESGQVDLLYISPESLRSTTIMRLLKSRLIHRFVIDEAHSMSTWGHDFRVDYLYIGKFLIKLQREKNLLQPIAVSCFTATAKPAVIEDIRDHFEKESGLALELFKTSVKRKNLEYIVYNVAGEKEKYKKLVELLQSEPGPKIVYVARVKRAEDLSEHLKRDGMNAAAYHGQMDSEEKIGIQNAFITGEGDVEIIVATTAFGMGVDKDNIKMVVHYNISNSLENYMQESGRAGRNENIKGSCYILFDKKDLDGHFKLLNASKLSHKEIYQIWRGIKRFKYTKFTKSTIEIAKKAGWDIELRDLEGRVKNALAVLEEAGYLLREENATRIFANSIAVKSVSEAQEKMSKGRSHFLNDRQKSNADRVIQSMISAAKTKGDTRTDAIAELHGLDKKDMTSIVNVFKQIGVLENKQDLTAHYYTVQGKRNSGNVFEQMAQIELLLFHELFPNENTFKTKILLRVINEKINEQEVECDLAIIRNFLNYWSKIGLVKKSRIDRANYKYEVKREKNYEEFLISIKKRLEAAKYCLLLFKAKYLPQAKTSELFTDRKELAFSLVDLKTEVEILTEIREPLMFYEYLLLYLHDLKIIELKDGLLIYYNPMKITRVVEDNSKKFTQKDYQLLRDFYQGKAEQIHIVGEYAKLRLKDNQLATQFVEDYFTFPYEDFLSKHFKGRKGKIQRTITPEKFAEIFGALSSEQMVVVNDRKNKMLVAAGPGSGKTRVLVHKVASLLLVEQVKPEQFLMLTFSKPAAIEFKNRLLDLVGPMAYALSIFTYHGFAFHLLGRMGNIEKSKEIITAVTNKIENRDIPLEDILAKSVLVIDEYQDVSAAEYAFIMAIASLSEKIKIIVAGDDDQNIYEFRGADVQYMRSFLDYSNTDPHFLRKNYRARHNLLEFTNRYLKSQLSSSRMKNDIELIAHKQINGQIEITTYKSKYFINPLVKDFISKSLTGSTGMLTHRNIEARLLCSLLKYHGKPAQLIADKEGFAIKNLLEVRLFTNLLSAACEHEYAQISLEDWNDAKNKIQLSLPLTENIKLLERIIKIYEKLNKKYYLFSWKSFLHDSNTEDFFHPDQDKLIVSTMHKSKGKEFDNVIILLNDFQLQEESAKRLLYVAMTRAKNNLFIYTNNVNFETGHIASLNEVRDDKTYKAPDHILLDFGMKDVNLSYFKNASIVRNIINLNAEDQLCQDDTYPDVFRNEQKSPVARLSKNGLDKLNKYLAAGYIVEKVTVKYVVYWFDQEKGKEFRVVLPGLVLGRKTEN